MTALTSRNWRWLGWALLVLAVLGLAALLTVTELPRQVEAGQNQIDHKPLPVISAHARALHARLTIVDLHADTLMWHRDLTQRDTLGSVDLPRLMAGHVALQVFSSVTKSPHGLNYDNNRGDSDDLDALALVQLQPLGTWGWSRDHLLNRSLWHAAKLDRAVADAHGALVKVSDPATLGALLRAREGGANQPVGAMLSIEGLHDLHGQLANLDKLRQVGFRMAGLTHFFDNELGGSMHGVSKAGLTPFGRQVVRRMEALGMIVDVAHLSHRGVAEVLAMATRPVVSSHGGVKATCDTNRNLTDDEIRGIARTGGVIGIGYWDAAVCDTDPAATARAMRHVRDLVGIQYVALGSDFDGATTTRFDVSQLVVVTQALIDAGFTDAEIAAVMGGNALRVITAGIVPARPHA